MLSLETPTFKATPRLAGWLKSITQYMRKERAYGWCQRSGADVACAWSGHMLCLTGYVNGTRVYKPPFRKVSCARTQDGDFSEQRFRDIVNAYLANSVGNLLNRTLGLLRKNCGGALPAGAASIGAGHPLRSVAEAQVFVEEGEFPCSFWTHEYCAQTNIHSCSIAS